MDEVGGLVSSLYDHLEATEELPVETDASRILGEAQAIAGDLTRGEPDHETIHERVETISELLAEVDETGDPEADEHVAAAWRATRRILER
jgi:hypothetical protein